MFEPKLKTTQSTICSMLCYLTRAIQAAISASKNCSYSELLPCSYSAQFRASALQLCNISGPVLSCYTMMI